MADTATKKKSSKKEAVEPEEAGTATATAKYVRVSARKMRLVADMVRGKGVAEARTVLAFSTKNAAKVVTKVLGSAVANAENNHDMSADELYISTILVNEGPTLKRIRPRAMGRAFRVRKRTCHVTVELATRKEG
ncbi:MAG: 50S ribosomal protein L22 [Actinobacteria bacterium]|nr:50S ribosomal protein L22 [Actinomycetota bacterium]